MLRNALAMTKRQGDACCGNRLADAVVLIVIPIHLAHAQARCSRSAAGAPPQATGLVGWLLEAIEFYRQMASTIRAAKTDGTAVWTLTHLLCLRHLYAMAPATARQ